MVKSVLKYTKVEPEFVICDNGGNNLDRYKLLPNFRIIDNKSGMRGSLQHGDGLNKIVSLSTTKYTAIIESDCFVLSDKWFCINDEFKIAAAKKTDRLYYIYFLLFETELLRDADFRPGTKNNRTNRSYVSKEDVGWQITETINNNKVLQLNSIDCKTGQGKCFNKDFQADELWLEDEPIAAHFGRGSNLGGKAIREGFRSNAEQLAEWKKIAERIIV